MRRDLPRGTVTFLFTDVEGSTRLLEELGAEGYAESLGEHRRVVRDELAEHGGVEVDTQGDAFFCAFGSARNAVACAADVTERLRPTRVRVRIGLHTGEALVADDHYVGLDVHRAARVGACGHGGQVVLSPSTVALLEPGSFALTDLGAHRLKDLSAPVRLHQLGAERFPPLKTLRRTNLPVPAAPFLGRARELHDLVERAAEPGTRLLTLTGPGGTGKTRLALQLAAELGEGYPDGVLWAPLAPLRDSSLVASTVAGALGVQEQAGVPLVEAIAEAVAGPTLLLLDNCEHVLDGVAAALPALLARAGSVLVLATSREPLGLTGERVWPVDPLVRDDSVALFLERSQAAGARLTGGDDELRTIAALCARLDDLPLAVELAAARVAAVPPAALLERLSARLDLLRGPRDADDRQRTLRGAIAWSHDLLDAREQAVFRRLAVFAGAPTLDAVEEVCEGELDDIASLVAKSLLRVVEGGRYLMLATIREFAAEQLAAAGELDRVGGDHLGWYARRARELDPAGGQLRGAAAKALESDASDLRVAFAHAVETRSEEAPALGATLGALHIVRGRHVEAEETVRAALVPAAEPGLRARLRCLLGGALVREGRLAEAWDELVEAERILELDGERSPERWVELIDVWQAQALYHYWCGDRDALALAARRLEPVVEEHGTRTQRADLLDVLLHEALRRERYVLSEETERLARRTSEAARAVGRSDGEFLLGFALLWRGRAAEAATQLESGLEAARASGDVVLETRCLVYGAVAARKLSDVERVRAADEQLAALDETYGYDGLVAAARAWLALRDGDREGVEHWGRAAIAHWGGLERAGPTVFQWAARFPLLAAMLADGRVDDARAQAEAMLHPSQQPLPGDVAAALEGAVAGDDGALVQAVELGRRDGYV